VDGLTTALSRRHTCPGCGGRRYAGLPAAAAATAVTVAISSHASNNFKP